MARGSIGDAHCHLADLADPDAAVAEAVAEGVAPILAVAMDAADGERILALAARHPGIVLAGVGLHPSHVAELSDEQVASELGLIARQAERSDFIGEIGLDDKDATTVEARHRQRESLERLLDLAERHRLPVNLHTIRADRELLDAAAAFRRRTGLPALIHWFTHSSKLARRCGKEEIFISVGPSILFDPRQAEVCRHIDPDFLLVETDAPVVYGDHPARPAWAKRVAAALSGILETDDTQLTELLAANLARFLHPDGRAANQLMVPPTGE